MVEESDRPGRGQGEPYEGGRRNEDVFAERRAMRAAETGDAALIRRAEAAEATVHTLERHVLSLQQRLDEAEAERARLADLIDAERTVAIEREHELRRVKQREYAEQQLRVEAEDRLVGVDRESRADLDELRRRLAGSEREAAELGGRLQSLQRQLSEAEQGAAAEQAALRSTETELTGRMETLEQRAAEVQVRLDAERAAREGSERLLETVREGHRRMETLVDDVRGALTRLSATLATPPPRSAYTPPAPLLGRPADVADDETSRTRGEEMGQALAEAVERLRARADAAPAEPAEPSTSPEPDAAPVARAPQPPRAAAQEAAAPASVPAIEPPAGATAAQPSVTEEPAPPEPEVAAATVETPAAASTAPDPGQPSDLPLPAPAQASETPPASLPRTPSHKHSMSLFGRIRNRRKQRPGR